MLPRTEKSATQQQLLALLNRLDRERADLFAEAFGSASEDGGGWDLPRRPNEQGGVRLEDEVTLGLLANEECLVAQIGVALNRLKAGTYGCCQDCARPIPIRRLRAIPYARHCIECARSAERQGAI
jgi:RNA polymerase-binding transcription factor DksA